MPRRAHITVSIKGENLEKKLRQFKKKVEREGIIKDAKKLVYFESKSQKTRKRFLRAQKVEKSRRLEMFPESKK